MSDSLVEAGDLHLVLHALAIKKYASPSAVAELSGLDEATVTRHLTTAVERGRVMLVRDAYALSPLARLSLESEYSRIYGPLHKNAQFVAAYDTFESINRALKLLMTDWQTMDVGGRRITNDHSDSEHDRRIVDRLGALHDRVEPVLVTFEKAIPRLAVYRRKLLSALERCEEGDTEWVSGVKIDSYHTVWFELHEDLLRMIDRQRDE